MKITPYLRPAGLLLLVAAAAFAGEQPRVLPLEGAQNVRELGGYPTTDGHRVKTGRLFRSAELSHLTPTDAEKLGTCDIAMIFDLRAVEERAKEPTTWAPDSEPLTIASNYHLDMSAFVAMFREGVPSAAAVSAAMTEFYRDSAYRLEPLLRLLFAQLARSDEAVLWHCSAGKDRTGVAAALVLTALGVDRATILKDYVLSAELYRMDRFIKAEDIDPKDPAAAWMRLPPDVLKVLGGVQPEWINATFSQIESDYGSVANYLDQRLGVGADQLAAIRANFLE